MSRLLSRDVPQADKLETVVAMVRHLAGEAEAPADLAPRHVNYYRHAARILGLVDERHAVTPPGHALAHAADPEEALSLVLAAFERSDVGRAWLSWADAPGVGALDPGSAGPFLAAASELSASTAKRRASTLSLWARRLRGLDTSPPSPSLERARRFFVGDALAPNVTRFLAEPVDHRVPTRMANWAARNDVETFGDLVAHSPLALLEERNLGGTSIRKTRQVIEGSTGLTWEALRARLGHEEAPVETPVDDASWDALRRQLPEARGATPLEQIPLPKRMLTFVVEPRGLETLGQLVLCEEAELRAVPKLGRRTVTEAAAAIRAHLESLPRRSASEPPDAMPSLDDLPELMAHVLGRASRLAPVDRLVFSRRAGFHGAAPKLGQLGDMLGVGRERVRQLEMRAVEQLAREWWVQPTRARIEAALEDGALPLERLARDALFSEADDQVEAFDYLLRRVLGGEMRVVRVGSETLVARANPSDVETALTEARRRTRALDFPVPLLAALEPARREAAALCAGLVPYFEACLRAELTVADGGAGAMATGLGNGLEARLLAYLESLDGPVRRDVAEAAIDGRCGRMPDAVIYVARGVIALPKHVPDFHLWMTRLSPLCISIMREEPGRQWSVTELLDEASERAQLPDWMGHWHLASMLRHGGQVRYLGRLQVALDEDDAPEERRHVRDLLRELLRDAGGPVPLAALLEKMSALRGGNEHVYRLALLAAPFVQVDVDRYGLLERDLPGGPEALAEAANALEAELEARQQGVGAGAALTLIRELSPEHESWTLEMAKTVARLHDAFRLNRSGGIGLADWDDERLPTRRAIITGLVEQEGGRVPLARVMDAIEAAFGRRPSRVQIGNLGSPHGLRLRGGELVHEAVLEEEQPEAPTPMPRIQGFPGVAEPLFRRLLAEPPVPLERLRAEARAYVEVFERARDAGSLIDPDEARRLSEAAVRLLERTREAPAEEARLARAAVRYFVVSADAEDDFAIGGLDDDAAVLDAVARHLGHDDCAVQLGGGDLSRDWVAKLPRGPVRDLFAHVASYGSITEPEALGMLGGARELRRFARRFETHTAHLPFRVRIEILDGVKRYVREGTRA